MTALAEITDALHKLRVSFVQSLVNVAAQRIGAKGMDHGPVLINVSGSTIGIRSMIDEVGQILGLERLYIDITSDGQSRSDEHTSELQSLMRISYAVFCVKKKTKRDKEKRLEKKTKT